MLTLPGASLRQVPGSGLGFELCLRSALARHQTQITLVQGHPSYRHCLEHKVRRIWPDLLQPSADQAQRSLQHPPPGIQERIPDQPLHGWPALAALLLRHLPDPPAGALAGAPIHLRPAGDTDQHPQHLIYAGLQR